MRFDVEKLAQAITEKRGKTGLRDVAKVTGVSAATLSRIGSGETPNLEHAVAICEWLGRPLDDFVTTNPPLQDIAEQILRLWDKRFVDWVNDQWLHDMEIESIFEVLREVLRA